MSYTIRPEAPGDAQAIHEVTRDAFQDPPHTSHTEQHIVDSLRAAGALSVSLVAVDGGRVIGHVAVSPMTLSGGEPGWYGLGPISVLPAHQGRGVGSALMRAVLAELRRIGAAGCLLVGDPRFYARFGFTVAAPLLLPNVPPEYFQALVLAGAIPEGTAAFHPAFEADG
jgi:putative acetyltransferase